MMYKQKECVLFFDFDFDFEYHRNKSLSKKSLVIQINYDHSNSFLFQKIRLIDFFIFNLIKNLLFHIHHFMQVHKHIYITCCYTEENNKTIEHIYHFFHQIIFSKIISKSIVFHIIIITTTMRSFQFFSFLFFLLLYYGWSNHIDF